MSQPVGQQEQPVEQDAGECEQMAEYFASGGGPSEHASQELAGSTARATREQEEIAGDRIKQRLSDRPAQPQGQPDHQLDQYGAAALPPLGPRRTPSSGGAEPEPSAQHGAAGDHAGEDQPARRTSPHVTVTSSPGNTGASSFTSSSPASAVRRAVAQGSMQRPHPG